MKEKYMKIKVYPTTMIIYIIRGKKITLERRIDLIDLKERQKRWISNFMHFYRDYELRTTWEDIQYIRSIGIRI